MFTYEGQSLKQLRQEQANRRIAIANEIAEIRAHERRIGQLEHEIQDVEECIDTVGLLARNLLTLVSGVGATGQTTRLGVDLVTAVNQELARRATQQAPLPANKSLTVAEVLASPQFARLHTALFHTVALD